MSNNELLKQKLSEILLNPNVIIEDCSIENEVELDPDYLLTNYICDTPVKRYTGRRFIKLTIFKNDNTTTKTESGTAKGTTTTSSKILHPGQSGYTGQ